VRDELLSVTAVLTVVSRTLPNTILSDKLLDVVVLITTTNPVVLDSLDIEIVVAW